MLYKKNNAKSLDKELFKNPTCEYRGTPFWAWNCKLEQEELERQIDVLREMGFGGFHMHVRTGMDTPYLSDEYMSLIRACVDKAERDKMLAWLYDEDRWPSGAAGGIVTKDVQYRMRYLRFTPFPYADEERTAMENGGRGSGNLLACFDVTLDSKGFLASYRQIGEADAAQGEKWYAYVETEEPCGWYNNQSYINTLDKRAMDRFIEVTYERYNGTIADAFDKTVPAIFTDEPQFWRKGTLQYAAEKKDVLLPWTEDLPETFHKAYGEDLVAGLPELFWDLPQERRSLIRYHYHDHVCTRFTEAFADNCGKWCREHNIKLTGHMMEEDSLYSQTAALGEAMRAYRGFDLPGIDMLCARFEYSTAKQTQSAVHQFGCEGMLSELYGVTNWDFDFRGHKLHGDWQAALGVTVRVPHLSWVSMAGEAKRDYPASINYQSPWWQKYSSIEDHFSRVNTAMTRGKPVVKVGMIHPVESYWLHWGPAEQTALVRDEMDEIFHNITKWLLFGSVDFDYISESLLPEQCAAGGAPLQVGEMAYDVILVPNCETLRSTTLERLEAFRKAGGKLVFVGSAPTLENAVPSERGKALYAISEHASISRSDVLRAVECARVVELRSQKGSLTQNLLHQLRRDGDGLWLFVAHGEEPYNKDLSRYDDVHMRIRGCWKPTVYNTLTGETEEISYQTDGESTVVLARMFDYDSLLLRLEPGKAGDGCTVPFTQVCPTGKRAQLPALVPYTLSEPNALLLDKAEYALDDAPWSEETEILRLDNVCRHAIGWPTRKENTAQPWVVPKEPAVHTLHLRYTIHSDIDCAGVSLAIEDAETLQITFNGEAVPNTVTGWYVDKSIDTVALPALRRGENILTVDIPFGKRTNVEWAYLLGDFGVRVTGRLCTVVEKAQKLAFGSITEQGLPFYGGNVTYHLPIETDGGAVTLKAPHYRGALMGVRLDGGEEQALIYPPYHCSLGTPAKGKHTIDLTLYGHRRNGFGPVHLADLNERWIGPGAWRSEDDEWTEEYRICEEGVLTSPIITEN